MPTIKGTYTHDLKPVLSLVLSSPSSVLSLFDSSVHHQGEARVQQQETHTRDQRAWT